MTAPIKRASFGDIKSASISSLPGYDRKSGHFIPAAKSASIDAFVGKIGAGKIEEEAAALFAKIKAAFGYTRKEITLDCDAGSALIRANDFDAVLAIAQHPTQLDHYQWVLTVDRFSGPEIVAGAPFNHVFKTRFSFLRLELSTSHDLENLIDRIEAGKLPGITCTYPRDCAYVEVHLPGQSGQFIVGKDWVEVRLLNQAPRDFVEALRQAQDARLYEESVFGGLLS